MGGRFFVYQTCHKNLIWNLGKYTKEGELQILAIEKILRLSK
jgi:hypothetical protein